MKQSGEPIEKYYNDLQGLWREIDFRRPNPMDCVHDIQKYNTLLQEDRVYTFLDGLDDRLDKIRSDVLQLKPFLTVEQAYAHVRREDIRQAVMLSNRGNIPDAAAMISRGMRTGSQNKFTLQVAKIGNSSSHGGGNLILQKLRAMWKEETMDALIVGTWNTHVRHVLKYMATPNGG